MKNTEIEIKKVVDLNELKARPHFSVMLNEVLHYLNLNENGTVIDCTFGAGGYSEYILKNTDYNVIGLDRDEIVIPFADIIKATYGERFKFHTARFSEIDNAIAGDLKAEAIILDLGLSTMQIKDASRGFSFNTFAQPSISGEGSIKTLSMNMGLANSNAYNLLNKGSEELLADVFHHYGEERRARAIARKIIEVRKVKPIETPQEFANLVSTVVKFSNIHPATKSFQAVRIYVNDELQEIQTTLEKSLKYLAIGGKIIVVSFHSLEDRIVKVFFNKAAQSGNYKVLTKKPLLPSAIEIKMNRASSSAKMRVLERIS